MTTPPTKPNQIIHQMIISNDHAGSRLDQVASILFPDYSRSRLQEWIRTGALTVDGRVLKPKAKLAGGEVLLIKAELVSEDTFLPEAMHLDIVYEDDDIIVINKPAGLVVHPAAGNWTGTLLNGLLHYCPELEQIPRAGIVHRLDKDTSGLMVVAKTLGAQLSLSEQLQSRTVSRTYWAVVRGEPDKRGAVEADIGRHPTQRTRMAVVKSGKFARTHYRVLRRFTGFSLMELKLETGRTHQIRVHMTHIGFPLVGDPVYGGRWSTNDKTDLTLLDVVDFPRQALHAKALGLIHPTRHEEMSWICDLPEDMYLLVEDLKGRQHDIDS